MRQIGREVLCCKHQGCPTVEVRASGVVLEDDHGGCLVMSDDEALAAADLATGDADIAVKDGVLMKRDGDGVRFFLLQDCVRMHSDEAVRFGETLDTMLDRHAPQPPMTLADA